MFMPLQKEIAFMDLTLCVTHSGIQTWLFEKALNLYLYIPLHSAHAPGILHGLVFGMTEWIVHLTSHWQDKQSALRNLFLRLCNCGYTSTQLRSLFEAALTRIDNRPLANPGTMRNDASCISPSIPKTQAQPLSNTCSKSTSSHHTANRTFLIWKTLLASASEPTG
jgi:hypothetical protein